MRLLHVVMADIALLNIAALICLLPGTTDEGLHSAYGPTQRAAYRDIRDGFQVYRGALALRLSALR